MKSIFVKDRVQASTTMEYGYLRHKSRESAMLVQFCVIKRLLWAKCSHCDLLLDISNAVPSVDTKVLVDSGAFCVECRDELVTE